jgi:hypothetical protein
MLVILISLLRILVSRRESKWCHACGCRISVAATVQVASVNAIVKAGVTGVVTSSVGNITNSCIAIMVNVYVPTVATDVVYTGPVTPETGPPVGPFKIV